jgi:hypothetical protein
MANRLAYLGLGAALMYFYDPQAGRKRRSDLQNRIDSAGRQLSHVRDVVRRDAANRMNGLAAETRGVIETGKREGLKAGGSSLVELAQGTARTWQRPSWSPAQRAFAGAFGAAFAMFGYFRGGVKGVALCALGSALVARATAKDGLPGSDAEATTTGSDRRKEVDDDLDLTSASSGVESPNLPPGAGAFHEETPPSQARH